MSTLRDRSDVFCVLFPWRPQGRPHNAALEDREPLHLSSRAVRDLSEQLGAHHVADAERERPHRGPEDRRTRALRAGDLRHTTDPPRPPTLVPTAWGWLDPPMNTLDRVGGAWGLNVAR